MTAGRQRRLGALQLGSDPAGTMATLAKVQAYAVEMRTAGLDVLVLPEALLGGYPKGADFGARVGYRLPEGRDAFLAYWREAVDVPGPVTDALGEVARSADTVLVAGVIERAGTTLYCTALFFTATGELAARRRKLVPTASERLIWGQGDGSGLVTMPTRAGRVAAAICWENYMPLLRAALYEQDLAVWCAPTVDDREIWQASMRHIAYEARAFVVSACQYVAAEAPRAAIGGGSVIVSPMGEVLAGPLQAGEGLVSATVDLDDIVRARFDLDVTGHYARPDVFQLGVAVAPSPGGQGRLRAPN